MGDFQPGENNMMKVNPLKKLNIVFCMDTEGPCDDPENDQLLKNWEQVELAMDKLFVTDFRNKFPDSNGGGLKIGWFFLTWTGFETNPRNRDFGYHKVRDHYLDRWCSQIDEYGDEQCWHYHHPAESRIGIEWGLDWNVCQEFNEIISRQILEREWFPVCFRAGGTIMDNQSSRWVDTWFPFDYSNRAPLKLEGLVDWSKARNDWGLYHPDSENFIKQGNGNRIMARCLDLMTGEYVLDDKEIHKAFKRAESGLETILSVFDHDYRDIAERIESFCSSIHKIAKEYPDVHWEYSSPVEAIRNAVGMNSCKGLKLYALLEGNSVYIWSSDSIFQHIPWIAIEDNEGHVEHCVEGLLQVSPTEWVWHIPDTLEWTKAGIAASSSNGFSDCVMVLPNEKPMQDFFDKPLGEHPEFPNHIEYHSKAFPRSCIERVNGNSAPMDAVMQAAELIKPHISKNTRLLDVGCASGQSWLTFKEFDLEYFGIDDYQIAIQIGKVYLAKQGLPPENLRVLNLDSLSKQESYDIVTCLFKFRYFPSFHKPLEIMARAANKLLVIRGTFESIREERFLPDVLLESGYQSTFANFNIYAKSEIESFLEKEGFKVNWIRDSRQHELFSGKPEVVGGIPFFYEFLVAERIKEKLDENERLGDYWGEYAEIVARERNKEPGTF